MSEKQHGRAYAHQAVKNYRRAKRKGGKVKPWMRGEPMMKFGAGGTDKSGSRKRSMVYYSDRPASR
jgi:hypothetical protein